MNSTSNSFHSTSLSSSSREVITPNTSVDTSTENNVKSKSATSKKEDLLSPFSFVAFVAKETKEDEEKEKGKKKGQEKERDAGKLDGYEATLAYEESESDTSFEGNSYYNMGKGSFVNKNPKKGISLAREKCRMTKFNKAFSYIVHDSSTFLSCKY